MAMPPVRLDSLEIRDPIDAAQAQPLRFQCNSGISAGARRNQLRASSILSKDRHIGDNVRALSTGANVGVALAVVLNRW